jgi:hypothetical protein
MGPIVINSADRLMKMSALVDYKSPFSDINYKPIAE